MLFRSLRHLKIGHINLPLGAALIIPIWNGVKSFHTKNVGGQDEFFRKTQPQSFFWKLNAVSRYECGPSFLRELISVCPALRSLALPFSCHANKLFIHYEERTQAMEVVGVSLASKIVSQV